MQGDGVNGTHAILRNFQQTAAVQMLSIYAKNDTNTLVQLVFGCYNTVHANFDILNGTITAQGPDNNFATITPGPSGFY
jgi:hypothetical protein